MIPRMSHTPVFVEGKIYYAKLLHSSFTFLESQVAGHHFLKISLGSVMLPIGTATSYHPLAPNSFNLVCIFWVSGNTSTIMY